MPNSKGKRYILTILDSFSRHFMAISCVRDAAHGLYQFFLCHREIPCIVSSDRGTHFTGEVYKQFCAQMSITQELHCPWWPQSSGNIERQDRMMKNALYMLCEDRNCEWTDILESVTSAMNATINSATGVSPHYAITGCRPNIGLPKLLSKKLASNDLGVYGMQINALLRQVHHCVALANDEADHKLEASLNHFIYKDPIQVGDKVLLHRPQSTVAQSSNLHWIGDFKVIKTNDVMSQVQNENGDTAWIHWAHIRHPKQQPAHLSHIPPPPLYHTHQNTQDSLSWPPFESHNLTQNSISKNIPSQPPENETKRMPIRLIWGQIPTHFKDFIMQ